MTVLMCNHVGRCDNLKAAGKTSVWSKPGELLSQLENASEGIIMFDAESQRAVTRNAS